MEARGLQHGARFLLFAGLATAVLCAAPGGGATEGTGPVVVGAGPHGNPSDRPGGGFLRVTFSPDGDGRRDRAVVSVRANPGDRLVLDVHPESSANADFVGDEVEAGSGITKLVWDGLYPLGKPRPGGSYVLEVCDTSTGQCAETRVIAHLRLLSVFTREVVAVSPGDLIPVVIATDRAGPYTLDLAPGSDPTASGVGARLISQPGTVDYTVPPVAGGLWILRVRSGDVVTHFPLVVHASALPLATPPPGTPLVVYPYITWRAYDRSDLNRDGQIDSWYAHPRDPVVPLTGPFENFRREGSRAGREARPADQQAFALWMREHQLTAQYVTDIELGRMPLAMLQRYAVIVFPGHTEYYERATYDRLLEYRDGGGRLYFLSGNSFYGEVKIGRSSIVRLSYRYRTPTQSDFRLAATGFRSCCWPPSITPRYHLAPGVRERLPWLFEGTDVRAGDEFGVAVGEVDTVDPHLSPAGTVMIASAVVPRFASSGQSEAFGWLGTHPFPYERSGVRPRRLAIAYAATGPGEVFSWGNTGFLEGLRDARLPAAERADLDRIALNVWTRFTR
jgi:hypothetical protein